MNWIRSLLGLGRKKADNRRDLALEQIQHWTGEVLRLRREFDQTSILQSEKRQALARQINEAALRSRREYNLAFGPK